MYFLKLNKNTILLLILISLLICLIAAIGINVIYTTKEVNFTSLLYVDYFNETHEILLREEDKKLIYRKEGIDLELPSLPLNGKPRLEIPLVKVSKNHLLGLTPIGDMQYNLTYEKSFEYVEFLKENGYNIDILISNATYVEVYMNKQGVYKRLIIFPNSIMVADMYSNIEIIKIETIISEFLER